MRQEGSPHLEGPFELRSTKSAFIDSMPPLPVESPVFTQEKIYQIIMGKGN